MQACAETASGEWRVTSGQQEVKKEVKEVQEAGCAALPVESLRGVEAAHVATLARRGVTTIGTLRGIPKPVLVSVFGKDAGERIWLSARGREERKPFALMSLIPFFARR